MVSYPLEDDAQLLGGDDGVRLRRDGAEEVACMRLRGANEDSGGAAVGEVRAVVGEPVVVVGDGGEALLGREGERGVRVGEVGQSGDLVGGGEVRRVELVSGVAKGVVVERASRCTARIKPQTVVDRWRPWSIR